MGKIFCFIGKSSSGKDTIFRIISNDMPQLIEVIPYTTRPIREGETEGIEYHFVTNEKFNQMLLDGQIIEYRTYHTVHGPWTYFTSSQNIDLEYNDYIIINTLEGYNSLRKYYNDNTVIPIYIQVEDGIRLQRALEREKNQENPKFNELCRRFLADQDDFSEVKLSISKIEKRFDNDNLIECISQIREYITESLTENKQYHLQ